MSEPTIAELDRKMDEVIKRFVEKDALESFGLCHDNQHPRPPDSAFRWSNWATCPCGAVRYEQKSARGEIISYSHLDGLRATDGTDISTRAKRDEYMRQNGLAHLEDYREALPKAREARERFFRGEDPAIRRELRETVGRAAYQLQTQRRNHR